MVVGHHVVASLMFAFTRSINSCLVILSLGSSLRCAFVSIALLHEGTDKLTTRSHLRNSVSVHASGSAHHVSAQQIKPWSNHCFDLPPVGSFSAGNISPFHMFHSPASPTRPANPGTSSARSWTFLTSAPTKEEIARLQRLVHCGGHC